MGVDGAAHRPGRRAGRPAGRRRLPPRRGGHRPAAAHGRPSEQHVDAGKRRTGAGGGIGAGVGRSGSERPADADTAGRAGGTAGADTWVAGGGLAGRGAAGWCGGGPSRHPPRRERCCPLPAGQPLAGPSRRRRAAAPDWAAHRRAGSRHPPTASPKCRHLFGGCSAAGGPAAPKFGDMPVGRIRADHVDDSPTTLTKRLQLPSALVVPPRWPR